MKKTAAVLCAALLTLGACGNSDDDTAKENIKKSVLQGDESLTNGAKPTEEQASCVADGMVDDIGVDKLKSYGLLTDDLQIDDSAAPTDLSAEDADALAGVFVDCVNVQDTIADSVGQGKDLTDEQKQCISDAVDEDTVKAGLSAEFQGKTADNTEMQSELAKCVQP